jgi:5-methylcytosine-specific restriction endonuclease McrA
MGSPSKRWAKGSTPAWRRVRAEVLARDRGRCRLTLPGCTTVATQVHHTRAREAVGDDPRYLVAVCQPCNGRAGDPTQHDPRPSPRRWWD